MLHHVAEGEIVILSSQGLKRGLSESEQRGEVRTSEERRGERRQRENTEKAEFDNPCDIPQG